MSDTTVGVSSQATAGPAPGSAPRGQLVGVLRERAPGERRVALVPEALRPLHAAGLEVAVESGAGSAAWFSDGAYAEAGAEVLSAEELLARADVLLTVGKPGPELVAHLRSGQVLLGMLQPLVDPALARELAEKGVTAVSLDGLPRTLSRAQPMDALTSQSSIAGYKAALVAAERYGRYLPMMITAAGTAKPADVLVLGAGVAGLQAMGTARRLGAMVTGYDVRPETKGEVESVGARFLVLRSGISGSGEGGYARVLSQEELRSQQEELNGHVVRRDIVITTAQVPGRRPPVLVTAETVKQMHPGAVIVDMAASALGGNVEGSRAEETVVTDNGVSVVGAGNLAASVPTAASEAFSHNLRSLLLHLVKEGAVAIDLEDEIQAGVVVTHGGSVVHPATAALLGAPDGGGGR